MNNKSIFDTLPIMPEGAEAAGNADTGRIRELVHQGIANGAPPDTGKKRRRFPVLLAAAVAVVLLIGGGIVACASLYVSPEDEMQRKLTEEYDDRFNEIKTNEREQIIEKYDLQERNDHDVLGFSLEFECAVETEANSEERKKVCDIVNNYTDNKYESYPGYHDMDINGFPSIDEWSYYFSYILETCHIYKTKELTVEEEMRILNFLSDTYNNDLLEGQTSEDEYFRYSSTIEKKYPETRNLWATVVNDVEMILKQSDFEEKYGQSYYRPGRYKKLREDLNENNIEESSGLTGSDQNVSS